MSRTAYRSRSTKETSIELSIDLDGSGSAAVHTGIPFYDHMLEQVGKHGGFDLRIEATGDGRSLSAADMHEVAGLAGAGGVFRRWSLGPLPWDAVGLTRQVSGGEPRDGLWAHPRKGTHLIIEGAVTTGQVLRGFYGLTDWGVAQATGQKIEAPVRFAVAVDDHLLIDQQARRTPGWTDVMTALDRSTAPRRLRVDISADGKFITVGTMAHSHDANVWQFAPDGTVLDVRINKGSGQELFDSAVIAAVKQASPLPRPPDNMRSLVSSGFGFNFRCPQ